MNNNFWQVIKFGGTSVSNRKNWKNIANIIKSKLLNGKKVLVVHSALSGVSNLLEQLIQAALSANEANLRDKISEVKAKHIKLLSSLELSAELLTEDFLYLEKILQGIFLLGEASDRNKALIMAQGEMLSTKIGSHYLYRALEQEVYWFDAREFLHSGTQENYLAAKCDFAPDEDLISSLSSKKVALTQGFIASNENNETVLTGRGGSDTSASYFAAKLQAECLEIWTDVEGIFTANPREVHNARLLKQLHYSEAQEMSSAGAKVLHPSAVAPVRDFKIPLFIRSTINPEIKGTKVDDIETTKGVVKAITAKQNITLISMESQGMWQQSGYLADLFAIFKKHQLSIDLVSTSETNVTVTLDSLTQIVSEKSLNKLVSELSEICRVKVMLNCSSVSIVGQNVRAILHKIAPALSIFETYPVYLVSQAASDLNLTFVLDHSYCDRVIAALHELLISNNPNSKILGPTIDELNKQKSFTQRKWWDTKLDEIKKFMKDKTSAYLYDLATVRKNIENLKSISSIDQIFYAVKANNNAEVLKCAENQGIGFETVSINEIDKLQQLFSNLSNQQIFFTPNFANKNEYQAAIERGVTISLDSSYPIKNWSSIFTNQTVFLRIDPEIGKGHHENVRTAGSTSKFGIPIHELEALTPILIKYNIKIIGLHAHAGSGILSAKHWAEHANLLARIAENFKDVRYLNLGGGFGIKEKEGQNELDVKEIDKALIEVKMRYSQFQFWIEPGRFIVANSGVLLTKVTQVKQKQNYYYVGVNTGMNSLMRPALYGSYHPILNLSKLNHEKNKLATIVGPICESTDKLGIEIPFPETKEGDLILIDNVGAYGHVMSNSYNLRAPAEEYCINN